jgi:hypothetical protein
MSTAKKPPPPWLDISEPQSDRARIQRCPRCRHPVIRALVGRVAALDSRADPEPLDLRTELAARLAGRQTWCLRINRWGPPRLLDRGAEHIAAGRCDHTVVAAHLCRPRSAPPPNDFFAAASKAINPTPDALF